MKKFCSVLVAILILGSALFLLGLRGEKYAFASTSTLYGSSEYFTHLVNEYPVNELPKEFSLVGENTFCSPQKIVTKPAYKPFSLTLQKEVSSTKCAVQTPFGTLADGYLQPPGTSVAGKIVKPKGRLVGSPNNSVGVLFDSSGTIRGSKVSLLSEILPNISTATKPDGTIEHDLSKVQKNDLYISPSQKLIYEWGTYSISTNGDWMVGEMPNVGHFRVNLNTGEIKNFGKIWLYNSVDPKIKMAVSPDGDYALVSSDRYKKIYLYDLNDCSGSGTSIDCKKKDITEYIRGALGEKPGQVYGPFRLLDSASLLFYDLYAEDGSVHSKKYILGTSSDDIYKFDYIGLGDSFASGEGAFEYKSYTDNAPINGCHLSALSYPYLISEALGLSSSESVACSGATIEDIITNFKEYEGQTNNGKILDDILRSGAEQEIYNNFSVGDLPQRLFVENFKPRAVTLSIGGNDIGFGKKIEACISPHWSDGKALDTTCFDTYEERKAVFEEIKNTVPLLRDTYLNLKNNNTNVYVVGYPKIVKPQGDCGINVPLDNVETDFADSLTTILNDAVEVATKQAGVFYVDAEDAFLGYRLCEGGRDSIAVHGVTAGDDIAVPVINKEWIGKESFHPNQKGHQLYKEIILSNTASLTAPMPEPDESAQLTEPSSDDKYYQVAEKTGGDIFTPRFVDMGISSTGKEVMQTINIDGLEKGLAPNSQFDIELHSTPVPLGSATSDSKGSITANVSIPENVPAGYHSLHFFGYDSSGQPIDIYDYFYVFESEDDFDGDGVPNSEEGCITIEPSGEDEDGDGVDDACDPEIKPVSSTSQNSTSSEPGIISRVNDTNTSPGVQQTSSGLQQTQVAGAQPAVSGFQTTSTSSQPSGDNVGALLNQGVSVPALPVVSAPYSSAPSAIGTPNSQPLANAEASGSNFGLVLIFIGALIVVFAVTTWNRYIKTPVPGPKTKRR